MAFKSTEKLAPAGLDKDIEAVRFLVSQERNQRADLADNQSNPRAFPELYSPEDAALSSSPVPAVIRNYHPDRKAVLRTSFALLLILKPMMIWGTGLLVGFLVLLTYLFAGPYKFWSNVINIHSLFARYTPAGGRQIKLRAYILAKRWDEMLLWLPPGLADELRTPDLREMIRADKRHHKVLNERLSRLG